MRSLKIVVLALLLLGVVLLGASFQLPLQHEVEQSIVLEAKPEKIYPYLENPTLWEKWNVINSTADPSMIRLYSGPMVGAGARMQWSGDRVGKGEVVFLESISPKQLSYKQLNGDNTAILNGSISLEVAEKGTKVTWTLNCPVKDEPLERWLGVWNKYKKHEELEQGLLRLKNLFEEDLTKHKAGRKLTARN